MTINEIDVIIGGKYKTPNNQERIVVGCNSDCKVVYASRGGNVKNEFDHRDAAPLSLFAEACSEKIGELTTDELSEIIEKCNAQTVIDGGTSCIKET